MYKIIWYDIVKNFIKCILQGLLDICGMIFVKIVMITAPTFVYSMDY